MVLIGARPWRSALLIAFGVFFVTSSFTFASDETPVPLAERMRGARAVVVATPSTVGASWKENGSGDRVIVSHFVLQVEETLKGNAASAIGLDLDGGTLDGFTLRVSSLPSLAPGERGVFILDSIPGGAYVPHLRGQGILKLDAQNQVKGSSLSLDEIRRVAASVR